MARHHDSVEPQARDAGQHRGACPVLECKAEALPLCPQAVEIRQPLGQVAWNLRARPAGCRRRRHGEPELGAVDHLARERQRCLEPVFALRGQRQAECGGADRGFECSRHLDLDGAGVGLLLHRISHAVQSAWAGRLFPDHRPAHHAAAGDLGVVVHDHETRRERSVRCLGDAEWPSRLEIQWFDDEARRLEGSRQLRQRKLRPACAIQQSEADPGERVHQVIREGAPARFEFPRAQVFRRVADQPRLVQLRRLDVTLETLVRRRQPHSTLGPVDRLKTRMAPGRLIVGDWPSLADRVPNWRVDVRQGLGAERRHHQRLDTSYIAPRPVGPAEHEVEVDVARRRDRGPAWVEMFERRLQVLVD